VPEGVIELATVEIELKTAKLMTNMPIRNIGKKMGRSLGRTLG
jgi:hypothetical protein